MRCAAGVSTARAASRVRKGIRFLAVSSVRRSPDLREAGGGSTRAFAIGLTIVVVIAGAFRLSANHYLDLDHNGAWHVFIAKNLDRWWRSPPHPPLFLVLLRACDAVRHSLLSYRAVPILSSLASVALVGAILRRMETRPAVALLGALTMACAQTATVLALEVESYSLCVLLLLGAFFCYVELVRTDSAPAARHRWGFATLTSLGLTAHYFTALFLVVSVFAPFVLAAMWGAYRRGMARTLPGRWRGDLATLSLPAAVSVAVYFAVLRPWLAAPLNHLLRFYFHPGQESLSSFLIRNLSGTVALFAPVAGPRARFNLPLLAIFLGAVVWAAAAGRTRAGGRRVWPALFLVLLLLLTMAFGVFGRYPFGGSMRHQFLIFVFALLAGSVAFDEVLHRFGSRGRAVAGVFAVAALAADVYVNRNGYRIPPFEPFEWKRGVVSRHLQGVSAAHLDHLNTVALMMERYTWDWRWTGHEPADDQIDRYELSGEGRLTLIEHRRWWRLDFSNPALYREIATSMRQGSCEVAFGVYQNVYRPPWRTTSPEARNRLEMAIHDLAPKAGLRVSRIAIDDDAIFAELCK